MATRLREGRCKLCYQTLRHQQPIHTAELQLEAAVQPTGHQLPREPVPYLCKRLKHHVSRAFVPSVCPSTASGRLLDACGWTASPLSALIPPTNSPMGRPALIVEEETFPRGLKSPP